MSHKPPVPNSGVSPYPLDAGQSAERASEQHALARETVPVPAGDTADGGNGSGVRLAVGAAIGSAAIAAALIYYNRRK